MFLLLYIITFALYLFTRVSQVINTIFSYTILHFSGILNSRMHYTYNDSYYFVNNKCALMMRCLVINCNNNYHYKTYNILAGKGDINLEYLMVIVQNLN